MRPVDAFVAELLDTAAGAFAGTLERVGEVTADHGDAVDGISGVVKARLDGAAGLAHALRDDDQLVDGVANLQPEQREQDKHGDNEEIGDDAIGEAVRDVWVEAHGPLLPTATGSTRARPRPATRDAGGAPPGGAPPVRRGSSSYGDGATVVVGGPVSEHKRLPRIPPFGSAVI